MSVVDRSFDHPLRLEEQASAPLAGGLMMNGYQCGMLWGAALAAGARAYQLYGAGPQAETAAVIASQKAVASFRARNQHIDCNDLTGVDWKSSSKRRMVMQGLRFFTIKGGPLLCFSMAARYAKSAYREIDAISSAQPIEAPPAPVSCTAMLAQQMGASELHTVMAAGFAGGIGLSGDACGVLGAAIWLSAMHHLTEDGDDDIWNSAAFRARGADLTERFLESSDYEFECSAIVGRTFEDVSDHAAYLRAGGCAKIIADLAAAAVQAEPASTAQPVAGL